MYRVCRAPCRECPFKARLDLRPGRLRDIVEETQRTDCVFLCHMSFADDRQVVLNDGKLGYSVVHPDGQAAVCAGWLEAVKDWRPQVMQIAERLGLVTLTEPR